MTDGGFNPNFLPPKAGEPPLHAAARLGNDEKIRALVAAGADVNAAFDMRLDPGGRQAVATPLMVAAGSGDGATVDTVRLLLQLGADPEVNLGAGTAAYFAAGGLGWNYRPGGDAARLKLLRDLGADKNETDRRGISLLAGAADTGDLAKVKLLLGAGVSPDPSPNLPPLPSTRVPGSVVSFQVPLFCAAESGGAAMVSALLEAGADVQLRDNMGHTALWEARDPETLRVLLGAGLKLDDPGAGSSPLDSAVLFGDLDKVEALLAVGADPNERKEHGHTVFLTAASSMERSPEMIERLVRAGADPMVVTEYGWNAFHFALGSCLDEEGEARRRPVFELLAKLGVDINHRDADGNTPLMRARAEGETGDELVLLELGAK